MRYPTLAASCAAVLAAAPLAAQPSLTLDAAYSSGYISRGLSMTSRPVAQGSATLSAPLAGITFSGGAWGNLEPTAYGPDALSMTEGEDGPNLTEVDVFAEASRTVRGVDVAVGVVRMTFPNAAVITSGANTTEVYARVGWSALPLSPRLSVNHDVDYVKGAYWEAAVSQPAVIVGVPVTVGTTAGWSHGQAPSGVESEGHSYAADGLTHVDAWMSAALQAGPLRVSPVAHVLFVHDELARTVAPERESDVKAWVGLTASWSAPLRRPRR